MGNPHEAQFRSPYRMLSGNLHCVEAKSEYTPARILKFDGVILNAK
jgi:hypothetical protein